MSDVATAVDPLMELAKEIYTRHTKIVAAKKNIVAQAIEVGELLNQAKAMVEHGEWLQWLKDNCLLKERTAERYMHLATNKKKLAEMLSAKSVSVSDLEHLNEAVRLISQPDPAEATPAETEEAETEEDQEETAALILSDKLDAAETRFYNLLTEFAKAKPKLAQVAASHLVNRLIKDGLYKRK
jgi:hypothetical protein